MRFLVPLLSLALLGASVVPAGAAVRLADRLRDQHADLLDNRRAAFAELTDPFGVPNPVRLVVEDPDEAFRQFRGWRGNVVATVFWAGELPTRNNPTPNIASAWDVNWMDNFGGYDDPKRRNGYLPADFTPQLNPFYIALPYNDVKSYRSHKPEAARVIPWFKRMNPRPGKTVLKGRWVQIYHDGRSCYAQWEDCGPWVTDDWRYVFGGAPPKNRANGGAGIDISPSIRDYLSLKSGEKCHWRFVEASQVPHGPWKRYGTRQAAPPANGQDLESKRRYLEYLRKLRDQQYRQRSLSELQR